MQVANASEVPFRRVFKIRKISARFFFAKQKVAKHTHMINEQSVKGVP